jgi:hypothetical protein
VIKVKVARHEGIRETTRIAQRINFGYAYSGQHHAPSDLSMEESPPVPIGCEAGCVLELVHIAVEKREVLSTVLCGSTALCWTSAAFFSFLIYTVGRTAWTGDQPVSRPLSIQGNTNTHTHKSKYPCLEWDLNPRS